MTVGTARACLSVTWVMCLLLLFVFMMVQSLLGRYGEDWDIAWNFALPLTLPTVSLIVTVWSVGNKAENSEPVHSTVVFWLAILISFVYLGMLWAVLLIKPLSPLSYELLFRKAGWPLAILQTIAATAVGKFFVENVRG
jgi:hypothetical protein